MTGGRKVCIIGAGSSGIASCQVLAARGIPFDCFERGSGVGGNWRFENDNGMSAAYRSLHINTSRRLMSYAAYPMPEDYPDYPSHFEIARYFDDYVDHFGFRDRIRFRTNVVACEPVEGGWDVTFEELGGARETARYRAVLVANGHHWDPRWPEPPFPGAGEFEGEQMHVHEYQEPDLLEGKRVLVLGIGNSGADLAVESSRTAERTFLALRRGAHIWPKYVNGKPTDESNSPLFSRLPLRLQSLLIGAVLRFAVGDVTTFGLPKPDHRVLEAHPTVSAELLPRLGHGDITAKPNIERFVGGRGVRFVDGSEEEVDLVIYCTGYKITFPFFGPSVISAEDNRLRLYRHVASVDHPGLYFIGFVQAVGAVMPLAEAQSEWVGDLLLGAARLPTAARMRRRIDATERRMRRRYVASRRHTIQVDFHPYLRQLRRERRGLGGWRPSTAR